MRGGWNRGHTKETSESVRKTSETMRARKLDNFAHWRTEARANGRIQDSSKVLIKNGDLAELLGAILGDGNIGRLARCECLRIVGNTTHYGFVERSARLVESVFGKTPTVAKRNDSEGVNITLYQKNIAARLGLPTGAKGELVFILPSWIRASREYKIRFLRGLYEAEGSLSHHEATYTHKFIFANVNPSLLDLVFELVRELGFHPHRSKTQIQVSRKEEVQKLPDLLQFRHYDS